MFYRSLSSPFTSICPCFQFCHTVHLWLLFSSELRGQMFSVCICHLRRHIQITIRSRVRKASGISHHTKNHHLKEIIWQGWRSATRQAWNQGLPSQGLCNSLEQLEANWETWGWKRPGREAGRNTKSNTGQAEMEFMSLMSPLPAYFHLYRAALPPQFPVFFSFFLSLNAV